MIIIGFGLVALGAIPAYYSAKMFLKHNRGEFAVPFMLGIVVAGVGFNLIIRSLL